MEWGKIDLVNELAAVHGYRSYLEICTATTGHHYAEVDRSRLTTCQRLSYLCPPGFDDGMAIDHRSEGRDIWRCLRAIRASGLTFDVMLVDPFHEYRESARDLRAALSLLSPGGTIVVHDCRPGDEAMAAPAFHDGFWCGVTYQAYLDLVLETAALEFCTVDTDCGCGIIRRRDTINVRRLARGAVRALARAANVGIVRRWRDTGGDHGATFRLLDAEPRRLLNLVTVAEFLDGERSGATVLR